MAKKDYVSPSVLSVGIETKWQKGFYGEGIVSAVLDTGCDVMNLDLKDRVIDGYNFTEEFNGDTNNYGDTNGHGSHVAGIIAGSNNNYGIQGIAPKVSLLIVKVLNGSGKGSLELLSEGLKYAMNWRGDNNERVKIISLSLGVRKYDKKLHDLIKQVDKKGITVVAAAGNDGDGDLTTMEYRYPASFKEVISVGAIDESIKNIADFSNSNEYVDVYAPGVNIYSNSLNNEFIEMSGTSMAVPFVAGSLAILIEEYEKKATRSISTKEVFEILMSHTTIEFIQKTMIKSLNLEK